jgi:hypothetical protein
MAFAGVTDNLACFTEWRKLKARPGLQNFRCEDSRRETCCFYDRTQYSVFGYSQR